MATTSQSTVVAVFGNSSHADAAASELKANGFSDSDIYCSTYNAAEAGTGGAQTTRHHEGGIVGWFKSLFGEGEHEDRAYYEDAVNRGQVLLSVDVNDNNQDRAVGILQKHTPLDVNRETSAEAPSRVSANAAAASATTARETSGSAARSKTSKKASNTAADLPKSIPVVEEDVRVGKRSVLRGGVRVYSRVVEKPVEETVRLRDEHVRVERNKVNRPLQADELRTDRDQVVEVEEYAEEPVLSKEARVVEEVRISKEATERNETVRDRVRHTEVNVENLGRESSPNASMGATASISPYDEDFRRDFETRYATSGDSYDDYSPAYQYGYQTANDPRFRNRSWDDAESDLRRDYEQRYPNSAWDRMKDSIRYGWDKVTGRAKSASASR